jgi:uncharacterized membrane protein YdjX (TVP38/TMEM64 family)
MDSKRAKLRLIALGVLLFAAWATVALVRPVDRAEVEAFVEPLGSAAPLVFVAVSTGLALVMVPGALLAAAAGLLFGALLGTAAALGAAVATSVIALQLGRRAGRAGVDAVEQRHVAAAAALVRRHGLMAVIVQRLAPAVPDGPMSYAGGALGVRTRDIALGTLIGAAPRGFGYAALGGSLDDLTSPLALGGLAVLGLTGVCGALLATRTLRAR